MCEEECIISVDLVALGKSATTGFIHAMTPQNHRTPQRHRGCSPRDVSVFLWTFCVSVVLWRFMKQLPESILQSRGFGAR